MILSTRIYTPNHLSIRKQAGKTFGDGYIKELVETVKSLLVGKA